MYPAILIDAIVLKVRDGQVANRPVYVAMGISLDGERDVLGMWLGPSGGEGAKHWLSMLTELKNRGVADVCIVSCDGLKGLPEAINATWPEAVVQTCAVHLVRNGRFVRGHIGYAVLIAAAHLVSYLVWLSFGMVGARFELLRGSPNAAAWRRAAAWGYLATAVVWKGMVGSPPARRAGKLASTT